MASRRAHGVTRPSNTPGNRTRPNPGVEKNKQEQTHDKTTTKHRQVLKVPPGLLIANKQHSAYRQVNQQAQQQYRTKQVHDKRQGTGKPDPHTGALGGKPNQAVPAVTGPNKDKQSSK